MRVPALKSRSSARSPPARRARAPFFAGPAAGRARRGAVPFFQPKLTIGPPGDRFEQEADRVADRIVAGETAPEVQRMCAGCAEEAEAGGKLRRQPAEEEELVQPSRDGELRRQPAEEEEEMLQPSARPAARGDSAAASSSPTSPQLASGIDGLRGGGQPLRSSERSFFEPRLGRDLSDVRLHTGPRAAELAASVNARAFTVGRDVVFGAAEYAPAAREGRRLLAHELTHVLQQDGAPPVARRKVKFDKPTYHRWNPIDRIVGGEEDAGRTTPVIDGSELPPNAAKALELVFKKIVPKTFSHGDQSGDCSYDDFDTSLSANVFLPTKPGKRGWRKYIRPADIKGTAAAKAATACSKKRNVPVRMIGKPDHQTIVKWVESNEQEHVDDLKQARQNNLDKYFAYLVAKKATDADKNACHEKLKIGVGKRAVKAAKEFRDAWFKSIQTRDAGGGHDLKNTFQVKSGCSRIKITSEP